MIDYFELLGEARRPWIDTEQLKNKFLALSAQFHPDRVHQSPSAEKQEVANRYTGLNAAYQCLREPKERVRHLLELELGVKPKDIEAVPQEMMDLFFETGRLCKEADAFLAENAKVTSPVLKVQLFERAQEWVENLKSARQKLEARIEELMTELKGMNAAWESASNADGRREALSLERLEGIYRLLGYLGRWSEQLQERMVRLAL